MYTDADDASMPAPPQLLLQQLQQQQQLSLLRQQQRAILRASKLLADAVVVNKNCFISSGIYYRMFDAL